MINKGILITKVSGEKDMFDETKLRGSLERSGANNQVIEQIIKEVASELHEGISTQEIYKKAFSLLCRTSSPTAARYKLKKALMELGPSGYPFEKFVGEILKYQGFQVKVGVIVQGHCVNHEVDVVAEKEDKHFMVECKFHNDQGRHCDVKIPLYIHSRFKDIEKQWRKRPGHETKFHQGWIVTNTRFTSDALQYGNCAGLILIGWDYPIQGSLKERINISRLYPITCLTTLTKHEKQTLLSRDKVLCLELCNYPELLKSIGISEQRHQKIVDEAYELCNI